MSTRKTKRKQHVPSIPTATSHLLTSTKSLLQSLTAWSTQELSVSEVSSQFVQFGDAFKQLKRSYTAYGITIDDIPDIPGKVRDILEKSLVLTPSSSNLDTFLPMMGDAVAGMMSMLKEKQAEMTKLELSKSRESLKSNSSNNGNAMDKLAKNSGLMRRASKRYSAYQTNNIMGMNSPNAENSFNSANMPKTPEFQKQMQDIEEQEIEQQKEVIQKTLSPTILPVESIISENVDGGNLTKESIENTDISTLEHPLPQPPASLDESEAMHRGSQNIFLKYKNSVKKVTINLPISLANIQVLFTQKFSYSSGSSFPSVYIQDGPNTMTYELEDIKDVRAGCILSLHEPDLKSAIFQHFETQLDSVRNDMMKMEDKLIKKLDMLSLKSSNRNSVAPVTPQSADSSNVIFEQKMEQMREKHKKDQQSIQDLKFELNKLRQHEERSSKSLRVAVEEAMNTVADLNSISIKAQDVDSPYMKNCKEMASEGCEKLVIQLDDLQDMIEVLKTDITKRGVKPSQAQRQHITKGMKKIQCDLQQLKEFFTREKKNWNNLWSKTLNKIVEDQHFFKSQEEIVVFLDQDWQSANETFDLILECAQGLDKAGGVKSRLPIADPSISFDKASEALFAQVESLEPNHEERVEAIKKLERVREMEKEILMTNEFQEELGDFVEAKMLKSSGGFEEIEKRRKELDEKNLKNMFSV